VCSIAQSGEAALMADQKKVLISGDVHGNLSALFKRVQAVNKANGPFDLLLCTGGFFPECGAHLPVIPEKIGRGAIH